MSTDTPERGEHPSLTHITLELSADGEVWIATDGETDVTTQGDTREHALEMLDDAVAAYRGASGREPTDAELRELGIDPEENTSGELPECLK